MFLSYSHFPFRPFIFVWKTTLTHLRDSRLFLMSCKVSFIAHEGGVRRAKCIWCSVVKGHTFVEVNTMFSLIITSIYILLVWRFLQRNQKHRWPVPMYVYPLCVFNISFKNRKILRLTKHPMYNVLCLDLMCFPLCWLFCLLLCGGGTYSHSCPEMWSYLLVSNMWDHLFILQIF